MKLALIPTVLVAATLTTAAGHYSIEREGDRWRLSHDDHPLMVRGAVGWSRLDALAAAGANAVRTGANAKHLDQARQLGLGALVGLPLGLPRAGFDYNDPAKVEAKRDRIRQRREGNTDFELMLNQTPGAPGGSMIPFWAKR